MLTDETCPKCGNTFAYETGQCADEDPDCDCDQFFYCKSCDQNYCRMCPAHTINMPYDHIPLPVKP